MSMIRTGLDKLSFQSFVTWCQVADSGFLESFKLLHVKISAKMGDDNDEEMVRLAFRTLDKDGSGEISTDEFKHLMTHIGRYSILQYYNTTTLQHLMMLWYSILYLIVWWRLIFFILFTSHTDDEVLQQDRFCNLVFDATFIFKVWH